MNTKEIECWKAVKIVKESGKMLSITITGPAQIEYHLDVWNKARDRMHTEGQDICVFNDLDRATRFFEAYAGSKNYCSYELWRCTGRGPHEAKNFVNPGSISFSAVRRLCGGGIAGVLETIKTRSSPRTSFPIATVMVEELMFVERIRYEEED